MSKPEGDPDEREIDREEREWNEVDPLLIDLENPPPEPVEELMKRVGKKKRPPVRRKPKETKDAETEEQIRETRGRLSEPPPLDDDLPVFGCGLVEHDKEEEDDDEPPPEKD